MMPQAARLVAAGNAATVKTYRRIGHYLIVAALAPVVRYLVLRDVDAFVAETLRRSAPVRPLHRGEELNTLWT